MAGVTQEQVELALQAQREVVMEIASQLNVLREDGEITITDKEARIISDSLATQLLGIGLINLDKVLP